MVLAAVAWPSNLASSVAGVFVAGCAVPLILCHMCCLRLASLPRSTCNIILDLNQYICVSGKGQRTVKRHQSCPVSSLQRLCCWGGQHSPKLLHCWCHSGRQGRDWRWVACCYVLVASSSRPLQSCEPVEHMHVLCSKHATFNMWSSRTKHTHTHTHTYTHCV